LAARVKTAGLGFEVVPVNLLANLPFGFRLPFWVLRKNIFISN
jgi:hypothetical protein